MVQDVALRLELGVALDFNGEALAQDVEERLLDGGHDLPAALDVHRLAKRQHLRLHPRHLVSIEVLQGEGLGQDKDLAVELVGVLALGVLNPEVFADRKELPAQLVGRPSRCGHRDRQSRAVRLCTNETHR